MSFVINRVNLKSLQQLVHRITITVDTGDVHEFVKTGAGWRADNQEGITASLVIPELDMVDMADTGAENRDEEEKRKHLFLPFSHPDCDDASITGGKGSSLG